MEDKKCVVISDYHHGEMYELRKEFSMSMFHRVYKRAYDIVQDCVYRQLEMREDVLVPGNTDNIVTFVGRRGTGKSSAMMSFMQGLEENYEKKAFSDFTIYRDPDQPNEYERIRFIKIDCIDASLLEQGEDIFEEILAKMFKEFLKADENTGFSSKNDYVKKDLYRRFDNLYKKHLNIKKRDREENLISEMAISNLRDLARSSDIRQEFQNLVEQYIKMESDEPVETFLVVAIDDMDMNVTAGFQILEKIQRYLRVKHLIILLAVNQEQMKLCCERHFAKMFENQIGYKVENRKKRLCDLADQYMEKALPSYTRVYLPSLKKMDYDRNHVTKIQLDDNPEHKVTIKMASFITMWRKTRVRYDVEGKKRHFMEPETLRDLNNNGIFRKHMKDLVWDKENRTEFLEQLDFNYRRCMDDLLFRYANEILSGEENKFFLQLSETDIRRRGEVLVTRFCTMAERNCEREISNYEANRLGEELLNGYRDYKYSYGEMLHAIYCVGRMDLYEKPLIHAILAMYSLTLTKIFYRYKDGVGETRKERQYEMLKELICDSVGGSWSRQLMPQLLTSTEKAKNGKDLYYAGTSKNVNLDMALDLSGVVEDNINEYDMLNPEDKEEIEWKFLLYLFITTGGTSQDKDIQQGEVVKSNIPISYLPGMKGKGYQIRNTVLNVDYNVMNFINNIFLLEEKIEDFEKKICNEKIRDMLKKHIADIKSHIANDKEHVAYIDKHIADDMEKEKSKFWKEMLQWHKKYGGMVVPIYAIDVYYNMFKRLVRDQQLRGKTTIKKEELYQELNDILQKIEKKLQENDKAYRLDEKSMNGTEETMEFAAAFSKCPVIKKLKSINNNEELKSKYNEFVSKLVEKNSNRVLSEYERRNWYVRI